jgi:hypothetical protein
LIDAAQILAAELRCAADQGDGAVSALMYRASLRALSQHPRQREFTTG